MRLGSSMCTRVQVLGRGCRKQRAERMDPASHLNEKRHEHKARLEWAVTTGCGSWPSRLDSTESARSARSASCAKGAVAQAVVWLQIHCFCAYRWRRVLRAGGRIHRPCGTGLPLGRSG